MSEEETTPPQEEEVAESEPKVPPLEPRDQNVAPDSPVDIDTEKSSDPEPILEPEPPSPPVVVKPIKKPKPKRIKRVKDIKPKSKSVPVEVDLTAPAFTLPKGLSTLPDFFLSPATDEVTRQIQFMEAKSWMCGVGKAKSYSALLTYLGPRRNANPQVQIAKRAVNPNQGNWRVWRTNIVFWKGVEKRALVKDPEFIQKVLRPKGGQRRYSIRFIEDDTFQKDAEKGRMLKTTLAQVAAFPLRVRQSRLTLGLLDTPLQKGEAEQVLVNIKAQPELLARLKEDGKKKLLVLLETRVKADAVKEKQTKGD